MYGISVCVFVFHGFQLWTGFFCVSVGARAAGAGRQSMHCIVATALPVLLLLQVGQSLDIEVLRGNAKEHVTAVLEANA